MGGEETEMIGKAETQGIVAGATLGWELPNGGSGSTVPSRGFGEGVMER